MPGIAAPQFLSYFRVGSFPEAAKVARHLDRPSIRREQRKDDRRLRGTDAGRFGQAE